MSTIPTVKVPSHGMLQTRSHNRLASVLVKYPSHLGSVKRVSRTFGLKSIPLFRATAMASYKIKLIGPDGKEIEFEPPMLELSSPIHAGLEHAPPVRAT